jgi:hypothetical protein
MTTTRLTLADITVERVRYHGPSVRHVLDVAADNHLYRVRGEMGRPPVFIDAATGEEISLVTVQWAIRLGLLGALSDSHPIPRDGRWGQRMDLSVPALDIYVEGTA